MTDTRFVCYVYCILDSYNKLEERKGYWKNPPMKKFSEPVVQGSTIIAFAPLFKISMFLWIYFWILFCVLLNYMSVPLKSGPRCLHYSGYILDHSNGWIQWFLRLYSFFFFFRIVLTWVLCLFISILEWACLCLQNPAGVSIGIVLNLQISLGQELAPWLCCLAFHKQVCLQIFRFVGFL